MSNDIDDKIAKLQQHYNLLIKWRDIENSVKIYWHAKYSIPLGSCWRYNGSSTDAEDVSPQFTGDIDKYELALGFLDGKPVFKDSTIYEIKDNLICKCDVNRIKFSSLEADSTKYFWGNFYCHNTGSSATSINKVAIDEAKRLVIDQLWNQFRSSNTDVSFTSNTTSDRLDMDKAIRKEKEAMADLRARWIKIENFVENNKIIGQFWKFCGRLVTGKPSFSGISTEYELPIGFLNKIPVFKDSIIYGKYSKQIVDLSKVNFFNIELPSCAFVWDTTSTSTSNRYTGDALESCKAEWTKIEDFMKANNIPFQNYRYWKYDGKFIYGKPSFSNHAAHYEFPIGFLDRKPVFNDSVIYNNYTGRQVDFSKIKFTNLLIPQYRFGWKLDLKDREELEAINKLKATSASIEKFVADNNIIGGFFKYHNIIASGKPKFLGNSTEYEFPIAFLSGRPVFKDSIIYDKYSRQTVDLSKVKFSYWKLSESAFTWEVLSCPETIRPNNCKDEWAKIEDFMKVNNIPFQNYRYWKYDGKFVYGKPSFSNHASHYEFPIGFLNKIPVFRSSSTIYDKFDGSVVDLSKVKFSGIELPSFAYSWDVMTCITPSTYRGLYKNLLTGY